MPKALMLISNGFEEIEAVTIVDVLRRADVGVVVAGLEGESVVGAHEIRMGVDTTIDQVKVEDFDALILPGGTVNANQLRDDDRVQVIIREAARQERLVAAICAAPIALERAEVLVGKRATSYPGNELPSAEYSNDRVVEDGLVITSRGPGTALEFSLALVRRMAGHVRATELRQRMLVKAG